MHACLAAGYEAVVPASWGDELVAARVVERIRQADGPALQCSCPRVVERLEAHGDVIRPMLICTVSPAVATAEYLRALYAPARPTITVAGGCGGGSEAIDSWLSAAELFAALASRGIALRDQPTEFETLPPDRRRFHSEPGGLPSRATLRQLDPPVACVEIHTADFVTTVGQHLLSNEPVLLDVAAALGCSCAGAAAGVGAAGARARVREHEPPRAPSPIVDARIPVVLDADPPRRRELATVSAGPARQSAPLTPPAPAPAAPVEPLRRRSPPGLPRPVFGTAPRSSRTDGRALPRAYVARRRSSPEGMKRIDPALRASAQVVPLRTRMLWIGGGIVGGVALMVLALLLF